MGDTIDWEGWTGPEARFFLDFLVSSCTASSRAAVLYKEMKRAAAPN